jgi:two-component system, OmpR family, phosphate regulon sensor histidine kinase PhoR
MDTNLRILVVDDSEVIRETMENHIRDAGYAVESAGGMHEALLLHGRKPFDLFLIDVVMPDVNGLTLLKELKIYDNTYEAVMVTGHECLDDAAKAMELGAFGYLVKPVKRDELIGMVQKALAMVKVKKNRFDHLRLLESSIRSRTQELESANSLLETQTQRLDAIINSMGDGLLAIDRENAVVLLNGQAEKILDIRFGDCAGQRLDRIQGRCSSSELLAALNGNDDLGKKTAMSLSYDISGKGVRHYNVNISEMFDKNGKNIGKLALFNDHTEKISAEHLRNSFLTILAHELRTPLTIIMNYLPLLASDTITGPQKKEAVADMRIASLRMKKLIDTIMSITLLSGPSESSHDNDSDVDVRSLVENEIEDMKTMMGVAVPPVRIENLLACSLVRLDPTLAKIVVNSLLSNAVKFTRGNGDVTVRIEEAMLDGRQAKAMIFCDQGSGLTDASKKHLFEVFSQGEDHLTRKSNGLGSGLFLAKRAAELLGGTLSMQENAGGGMSFIFTMPARSNLATKQTING